MPKALEHARDKVTAMIKQSIDIVIMQGLKIIRVTSALPLRHYRDSDITTTHRVRELLLMNKLPRLASAMLLIEATANRKHSVSERGEDERLTVNHI